MHGVPLLRIWTKFQKFTLMLIRKVSEIGVVICSKNIKQRWEESKRNLAPVRKILNLIIYCKTLQKNGMKLLYHMMINRSKNCKRLRLKKAIQTMYDNKLWRLSLKLGKENSKMTVLGANQTMAQKPWYILKVALNKNVILKKKNLN